MAFTNDIQYRATRRVEFSAAEERRDAALFERAATFQRAKASHRGTKAQRGGERGGGERESAVLK